MKEKFIKKNFKEEALKTIATANAIIIDYQSQGFSLTLRQLYYQFVSRDLIENKMSEYKRLGKIINDGRMAGLIDWKAIEDRTRSLNKPFSVRDPEQLMEYALQWYKTNPWRLQETYVEVWIEKDALTGVIEPICDKYHVPSYACRGYNSQSEQYDAGKRFANIAREGQRIVILHLGDHDPSGIDMSRDNDFRLSQFMGPYGDHLTFKRLGLNMDQIEQYDPPPNFAKLTDTRSSGYVEKYGDSSWELDALEPKVISALLEKEFKLLIDESLWQESLKREATDRANLENHFDNYSTIYGE